MCRCKRTDKKKVLFAYEGSARYLLGWSVVEWTFCGSLLAMDKAVAMFVGFSLLAMDKAVAMFVGLCTAVLKIKSLNVLLGLQPLFAYPSPPPKPIGAGD
jgi:hypothetical protein